MAGFHFSLPTLGGGSNDGLTLQDKLLAFAAIAQGHPEVAMQLPQIAMQRRLYSEYLNDGQGAPGDGGSRAPTQAVQASTDVQPSKVGQNAPLPQDSASDLGGVNIPQLGVSAPRIPMAPATFGQPAFSQAANVPLPRQPQGSSAILDPNDPRSMRRFQLLTLINPQAAAAQARGAMATRPDMTVGPDGIARNTHNPDDYQGRIASPQAVNNTVVDMTDPRNINRNIPSPPVPGAKPVYDNIGNIVDWTLPPGAKQAILDARAEEIRHNRVAEGIEGANAVTGRINAGTGVGGLANTQTQNVYVPPPGFVIRQKGNR